MFISHAGTNAPDINNSFHNSNDLKWPNLKSSPAADDVWSQTEPSSALLLLFSDNNYILLVRILLGNEIFVVSTFFSDLSEVPPASFSSCEAVCKLCCCELSQNKDNNMKEMQRMKVTAAFLQVYTERSVLCSLSEHSVENHSHMCDGPGSDDRVCFMFWLFNMLWVFPGFSRFLSSSVLWFPVLRFRSFAVRVSCVTSLV